MGIKMERWDYERMGITKEMARYLLRNTHLLKKML